MKETDKILFCLCHSLNFIVTSSSRVDTRYLYFYFMTLYFYSTTSLFFAPLVILQLNSFRWFRWIMQNIINNFDCKYRGVF